MLDIEKSLSGNICRCTGYRPILETFKKFASDAPGSKIFDIEDMDLTDKFKSICSQNTCNKNDWCIVSKDNLEHYILHIELQDGNHWYRAQSVADIFQVLKINGDDSYMLVAGNTAKGRKFNIIFY